MAETSNTKVVQEKNIDDGMLNLRKDSNVLKNTSANKACLYSKLNPDRIVSCTRIKKRSLLTTEKHK